jgi:hypothetical protein
MTAGNLRPSSVLNLHQFQESITPNGFKLQEQKRLLTPLSSLFLRLMSRMSLVTQITLFMGFLFISNNIGSFANDSRVIVWDIYNEPGNGGHGNATIPLLTNVFKWARDANSTQPITSGTWSWGSNFDMLNDLQTNQSDIITFHSYLS